MKLLRDLQQQWVGVMSVLIAVTALATSQYRSDVTEHNRTLRFAAFEMLKELGALQQLVHQSHFSETPPPDYNLQGWNHVLLIRDFSVLLPAPVPAQTERLVDQWQQHWPTLTEQRASNDALTQQITTTREAVTAMVQALN
ncbi:hypothetical protein K0504_16120 [Neiella marina]|uniref:Uncharacterized protein n=1 Tax=Neiella holothuriorum TaxID=2870530 RepID=A0ABS7EJN3_9GAMM|nr:hypothetical protein [Neiella holothuriorum]MBW8192567.1 hypothetical protein [Neiella holothuriorum]